MAKTEKMQGSKRREKVDIEEDTKKDELEERRSR